MNIYEKLGLKTIVNAGGTFSSIGGSVLSQEVIDAMADASKNYVDMNSLNEVAGKIISEITGGESAIVTSGAAAGLALSVAACITRGDPWKMRQLPNTDGILKNQVIIQRAHMIPYEQIIRMPGAKLVEVGSVTYTNSSELESAINEKTAAIVYIESHECVKRAELPPEEVTKIARKYDVPTILDAAAELPPVSNFRKWLKQGFDLVVYSGGKAIGGPNDTGFIYGKADLIKFCAMQNAPNVYFGRPFKVSKEQIVGLIVALRAYNSKDHEKELQSWHNRVNFLYNQLKDLPGTKVEIVFPDETGLPVPRVRIKLDEDFLGIKASDVIKTLRNGNPSVVVRHFDQRIGIIALDAMCLKDGEEALVAELIKNQLSERHR